MPAQDIGSTNIATNLRAVGDRLEQLLDELRLTADPAVRERAEEAVRLVTELYGAGLASVVEMVVEAENAPLLDRIVSDELVSNLLVLHGLHPFDLPTRVGLALDKVRPYLASHGGDVEILDIDEEAGSVSLRLLGSCDGCPSSSVTLKMAVESAVYEAAPEVAHILVEGYVEPTPPPVAAVPATPVELRRKPVAAR